MERGLSILNDPAQVKEFLKWQQSSGQPVMTGPAKPKEPKKAEKYTLIAAMIHQEFDIIKVSAKRAFFCKKKDDNVYDELKRDNLITIVRDRWMKVFGVCEARELKECAETVELLTEREVDDVDNNSMKISDYSYWNAESGEITTKPERECFRRLFNTKYEDKHTVKVPAFTKEQDKKMRKVYKEVLEQLNDGVFEERYDFIKTWADGNHDVYLDIMRAVAYCFVKKKPVGAYILVGLRRNGKSSFVGMLHTIFGRDNTSTVRLSELGNPHYVNRLRNSMLNAPDEEDEKAIDAQANFKTMADHGMLTLEVMRSNEPLDVYCNFMSFFPMNHIPEWRGTGAAACMKRSLVIPFYADLSEFDKKNFNFAKETFTADMMADFMGCVFAYASYYTEHELEFSESMLAEQEILEEELDSSVIYRKEFEQFFDGFESMKLLYQDYCNWCKTREVTIAPRKEFKFVFRDYTRTKSTWNPPHRSGIINVYRIPSPGKKLMYSNMKATEVGDLKKLHELECSIVERSSMYYGNQQGKLKVNWDKD